MRKLYTFAFVILFFTGNSQTYYQLSGGAFTQNWTDKNLISVNDDWNGVPSIIGYRGDNLTVATGVDPRTVLAEFSGSSVIDVNANITDLTFATGGIIELDISNPTIAFQGSGTADAPSIVLYMNTTGVNNVRIRYNLRDMDGGADDAVQSVALQYRIGTTGDFINVADGYVADASQGGTATLVTAVNVLLPSACDNQSQLQIRIITTNAAGNDELIGIDDIEVVQDAPSSINNIIRNPNYVRISGNPSSVINIQFNEAINSDVQTIFFDAAGQMVLQKRLGRITEGQVERISLAHLPKGLYILSIKSKDGTFTAKVVN